MSWKLKINNKGKNTMFGMLKPKKKRRREEE